ncbi:acyl-CoA N-acyltransferase [Rhizophagus irregularis]|uniref:Acyl-CoA N-acyltransferase n=1 Tax=Rhizophagus irregularis TaxID=588596 RepID=A0A2N1NFB7_9GLOM|nr:acyl-CoA N-acyltransferase [Rhizophagus irregularis]
MNSLALNIKSKGPFELNLPKKATEKFHLSALKLTDIPQIVSLLGPTNINSIDIHKNTSSLPNPYTLSDAEWFVNKCIVEYTKTLQCNIWAIQKYAVDDDQDKKLFNESYEIGYYISSEYRGLGIVSAAANFICNEIAFKELHLNYIIGMAFANNEQSHNVLKRCGFKFVKLLKNALKKGDEMRDVYCNREIHLSALKLTDIPQIVSLLGPTNINSIDIHENTFTLPNPYTLSDAEWFVNKCIVEYTKTLQCNIWAIQKYAVDDDQDKKLFNESYEIGYYISSEYRGLGIVSAAANFICNEIAFKELHLDYIIGMTFVNNEQSHNVLKLKGVIKKGDEMRDVYLFIKEREVEQTHNIYYSRL